MELNFKDNTAKTFCRGRSVAVVAFIHQHLGLASVADVSYIRERDALKLETATGSILVNTLLTKKLDEN